MLLPTTQSIQLKWNGFDKTEMQLSLSVMKVIITEIPQCAVSDEFFQLAEHLETVVSMSVLPVILYKLIYNLQSTDFTLFMQSLSIILNLRVALLHGCDQSLVPRGQDLKGSIYKDGDEVNISLLQFCKCASCTLVHLLSLFL